MTSLENDLAEADRAHFSGPATSTTYVPREAVDLIERLAAHVRERLAVNVGLLSENAALKRKLEGS